VAEAQAMAVTELIAHAAADRQAERRAILLAADDYSAVSRRVPLSNLYERGRSLGLGVMVSAQSWQGLGQDEDERYRIAATADGGLWLLQTPYPEPFSKLAGTRQVLESATSSSAPAGATRAPPASSTPSPSTATSCAHSTPARPATSAARPPSTSRPHGPAPPPWRWPPPGAPARRPSRRSARPAAEAPVAVAAKAR
jgi:hypothetical protein